jgi:hypothetical protein
VSTHPRTARDRTGLLAQGLRLEYLTVSWNVVEGMVAVAALAVSTSVLIDRRLSDGDLRTELSQGALRAALANGIAHPKFSRFRGSDEAPVTVEGWERLARVLAIADRPVKKRRSTRATPSMDSQPK